MKILQETCDIVHYGLETGCCIITAIKQINLSNADKETIRIDASTLSSGAYNYSLYADGKLISTKQMILTK